MRSINIPDSVTEIGDCIVLGCENLSDLRISPNHPVVTLVDGVMFSKDRTKLLWYPVTLTAASYAIPEGTQSIGAHAFYESCLASISIPDSVTEIKKDAFALCTKLKEITFPAGITALEGSMFAQCSSLETVVLPEGITSFGTSVFRGCTSLRSVNIPSVLTTIGRYTFDGCTALSDLTFPAGVTEAGRGIFNDCPALTVTVAAGSYMEQYCIDNGVRYKAQ